MKLKKKSILFVIVLTGILIVSQVHSLLANYNIVEDMSLTTSMSSLKEGEILTVSVTDSNVEDTKLVIPVDENTEYMASDYQDASVVFDQINHQVVIDWLEPSKEQKEVTIKLKMTKEGLYPLKALTVRQDQKVSTKEELVDVLAEEWAQEVESESKADTAEQPVMDKETESTMSNEQSIVDEKINSIDSKSGYGIKTGVWGTAPYELNVETGELKIGGGELSHLEKTPWGVNEISSSLIKKMIFTEPVNAPANSSNLFKGSGSAGIVGLHELKEITNLSYLNTSNVTNMDSMFENSQLSELDVSNFDTSKATRMYNFFRSAKFKRLKLGDKSRFLPIASLGEPYPINPDDILTKKWIKEDGTSKAYSSGDLLSKYGTDDLTPGTYVAETIRPGHITGETKLSNQTHSDGLFYEKDEVKLENKIQNRGELWNFTYDTVVPEKITVHKESLQGYMIIDGATRIDLPKEVFEFDESSQRLRVNLKSVAEPSGEDNYYSAVDFVVFYELTATINENTLNEQFKIDTTFKSFNNVFEPNPDVTISTGNKTIFGIEPKWTLEKELKNLSRSDELSAAGDEIEFTIMATNSEKLGAMLTFDLSENSFPNELDFISGSAELILPDGTTKKLPDSVYQPNKQMVSTNVFSGNGYVGVKPYQLRFKAKVKDTAYGKILETKANLEGTTHAGKELTIEDDSVKINVAYSGKLGFKETPKTLSFKDSFISAYTSTIERKDADWGVSIEDTRAQKQPWNLSVKQVSPFESSEGDKLTQVMIFRKNGIEDKGIDVDNEVDVYSENSPNPNDYFISWEKNEGFFLKVPPGTAKAKQYQTELQWNLKDTPI